MKGNAQPDIPAMHSNDFLFDITVLPQVIVASSTYLSFSQPTHSQIIEPNFRMWISNPRKFILVID
jgi:hypothetical protein